MKLRIVPASQGLVWLRNGLLTCWQQSIGFLGLMGLVTSAAMLLSFAVPVLGALVVMGATPTIWMGFMLASRRVIGGQRVTPGVLIEPVRGPHAPKKEWLKLGATYVAALIVVMQLGDLLIPDSDALREALDNAKDMKDLIGNPEFQVNVLGRWALTLPISLLFLHTPALVMWGRIPVAKALFFSAVASWRNLTAFAVYALGWFGVAIFMALVISTITVVIPVPAIAEILTVMLSMWTTGAFFASLYFTVVDCFEAPDQADSRVTPDNGQA
jgi:hypothetical protein